MTMKFLRGARIAAATAACAALAACGLTEVTTDPGEDVVVVEAVLRTDFDQQQVLVHRSLQGTTVSPVGGATVVITGQDGVRHTLAESSGCYAINPAYLRADSLDFNGTCYESSAVEGDWVRPGATYDLSVRTVDGKEIRGRTTVPGDFAVPSLPPFPASGAAAICTITPNTVFTLLWKHSEGAASYISDIRIHGLGTALGSKPYSVPDPVELRGLAISVTDTTIVFPTEFGVFERLAYDTQLLTDIANGFPDNVDVELVLAAADRNWVNSVRGGNFNPSGLIRISTVQGDGVGVFGSLVPKRAQIIVRTRAFLPTCGH
jgi:hypothetical protein